jgi:hypothetical protein
MLKVVGELLPAKSATAAPIVREEVVRHVINNIDILNHSFYNFQAYSRSTGSIPWFCKSLLKTQSKIYI